MNYRPDIDGLRTLAVLPVVLFHANIAGFSGGFVGVDVFFVISGYLITTILWRELSEERFSILTFYERRARRILPALLTVMLASLAAGWALLTPADYEALGQSILSALLFVSNIWFWQSSGGYFDGPSDYLPMLHTWSLAVEEQFYIFFPLLLMALHRIGRRLVLPVVLVMVLGSFALALWATPRMPSASFYLLPTRIWELGIGSLLALGAAPRTLPRALREGLGLLGLALVILPVFLYDRQTSFPGLTALPPVLGAALLIQSGGCGTTMAARLLSLRPMVFVGLISYSLYLWHWPIMAFLRNRLMTVELEPQWQAGAVLASLLAGWLSWRFVERPFRRPAQKGGLGQRGIFAGTAAGMGVLGLLAGALIATQGAARQRFAPAEIALLGSTGIDARVEACRGRRNPESFCVFGDPAAPDDQRWILWGDSHAEALMPALDLIARQAGRKLVLAGLPGCAALPGLDRLDRSLKDRQTCRNYTAKVEQHILKSGTYEQVFLHARWPMYVEGTRYGPSHAGDIVLAASGTEEPTGNFSLVWSSLGALLERFGLAEQQVSVIGSVPEIPWNVSERLKGFVLYDDPLPEDPDRAIVEARQGRSEALLAELSRRHGASFLPLTPGFCGATCPTHEKRTSFYRDTDHITPEGAINKMAPLLTETLLRTGF